MTCRNILSKLRIKFTRNSHTLAMAFALALLTPAPVLAQNADTWPRQEVAAADSGFNAEGLAALDAAMREAVANQDVAGMVWLLAKDGKIATYEHAGIARLNDQTPMTRDSLFRIYSMSKPVTGVALMMLWEDGLWEFDDPISKFIPEFENLTVLVDYSDDGRVQVEPLERQPTMRELLNHTAGFGYGLSGDDPVNNAFREQAVLASSDLDALVDKVAGIPLLAQPGEQWYYSIAVDIQGYIVQQISGMNYGDFLRTRLFEPLDMMDTGFYVKPEDHDRFAEVHYWDREAEALAQQPHRSDRPSYLDANRLESGGGGLVSSTHDYARFAQMLVNEGELEGTRILTPESVRIMRTNSLTGEEDLSYGLGGVGQPGIGFGVDFAVTEDPRAADTPQGPGTYNWGGAAGTTFWIDPVNNILWLSMIQAQGPRRPGAANFNAEARDLIYQHLAE
jgi:CubicO group peptidase (beta-lactamase class C family)